MTLFGRILTIVLHRRPVSWAIERGSGHVSGRSCPTRVRPTRGLYSDEYRQSCRTPFIRKCAMLHRILRSDCRLLPPFWGISPDGQACLPKDGTSPASSDATAGKCAQMRPNWIVRELLSGRAMQWAFRKHDAFMLAQR